MGNTLRRWMCATLFTLGLFSNCSVYSKDEIKSTRVNLLKARPATAVVNFTVDPSVKVNLTGSSIAVKLEQALGKKYRLVTRSQVSKALQELRFQSSDLVNDNKAKKFGHMLGAEYLITGSVVQIGKEITLACQRFNIKTGLIKQTAEVSISDVDEFNCAIREAAMILTMSAVEKQEYTDKKVNYPKYLKAGQKALALGNFAEAIKYFKRARSIQRTRKVTILLKTAEFKAEAQRISHKRKAKYQQAMSKAKELLRIRKFKEAEELFKQALRIPGYKYNKELLYRLKLIGNREYVINFGKFIDRTPHMLIHVPDDVKTIQAAMDMTEAGDTIVLQAGDYRETIVFKDGVTLKGHDKKLCRILPLPNAAAVIIALDCKSGSIENLTIDGSGQESKEVYGLGIKTEYVNGKYVLSGTHADIPKGAELLAVNDAPYAFHVYVLTVLTNSKVKVKYRLNNKIDSVSMQAYKGGDAGRFPDGTAILNSSIEVKNCILSNLKGAGIYAAGDKSKLTVKDNQCTFNMIGIYVDAMALAHVEKNSCDSNEYGIAFNQNANGKIINNKCNNNSGYGIYVNNKSKVVLVKNACARNVYGIVCNLSSNAKLIANQCNNNSHSGILVDNKSATDSNSNQCSNNKKSGIVYNRESTGDIIANTCTNNFCGIFVSTKSTAIVRNNKCNKNTNLGIAFAHGAQGKATNNICHQNKQGIGQDQRRMSIVLRYNSIINR